MSNPYTSQAIVDYNTSPPSDNAAVVASNQLQWGKHKSKLADPIKVLTEAINSQLVAVFDGLDLNQKRAIATNDTQLAADERKLISATNTITYTLIAAVTAGDGFTVTVLNAGTGAVTIDADGAELIGGQANYVLSSQDDFVKLRCNSVGWDVVAEHVAPGTTGQVLTSNGAGLSPSFQNLPLATFTGEIEMYVGATAPTGWLLLEGGTIGNASSGGSARANADTEDLFTLLWDSIADAQAPVSTGRGASAAADFAANKNITLLDMRSHSPLGTGDAGAGFTNRTHGDTGGAETHTLTTAELAVHAHNQFVRGTGNVGTAGTQGADATDTTNTGTSTANAGSGNAHANMHPWVAVRFIIKL